MLGRVGRRRADLLRDRDPLRPRRGPRRRAAAQRERRRRLFALAADQDVALGATGTHPWSDYREQQIIDTEHYRRVEDGLKYVAWRNNTFSLHVHVGIRGAERAVLVCDRLRPVLPVLLAISANSPFLDGRDSGLHSARTQTFTRSFPRCGVPDRFGSWDAFAEYIEFLVATRSIVEYTQVWWSIRPHFSFGTVEVRICDAQPTAAESDALAALIVACVAQAARDIDDGVPHVDLPEPADRGERVARDPVRARRRAAGPRARRAIPRRSRVRTAAAVDRAGPSELGIDIALPPRNGAQRQRRLLETGMDLHEIYAAVRPRPATPILEFWKHRGGDSVSTGYTGEDPSQAATEEELRAAYEAEIKKIRVEQVLLEQVVTLINLGMRRTGLSPAPRTSAISSRCGSRSTRFGRSCR